MFKPKLFDMYNNIKALTIEEEKEAIITGNRKKLITSFLPLVKKIASKYARLLSYRYFEDFSQEGIVGLIHGVDKFDSKYGYRMAYFLELNIRKQICQYINKYIKTVRLPDNLCHSFKAAKALLKDNKLEDALKKVDTSTRKGRNIKEALPYVSAGVTINDRVSEIQYQQLTTTKDKYINEIEGALITRKLFNSLSEKEKSIIVFKLIHGLSFKEIGEKYGFSKQRIYQIYSEAIQKVKKKTKRLECTNEQAV